MKKKIYLSISLKERLLLQNVAQRVGEVQIRQLEDGAGRIINDRLILPVEDFCEDIYGLEGIAAHVAAHKRFKSAITENLMQAICPLNPIFGGELLHILEDYRINILLEETYPGFFDELKSDSNKSVGVIINAFAYWINWGLHEHHSALFLLYIMKLFQLGRIDVLFQPIFRDEVGKCRFASSILGTFHELLKTVFYYVKSWRSFEATAIGAKKIIKFLEPYIQVYVEPRKSCRPDSNVPSESHARKKTCDPKSKSLPPSPSSKSSAWLMKPRNPEDAICPNQKTNGDIVAKHCKRNSPKQDLRKREGFPAFINCHEHRGKQLRPEPVGANLEECGEKFEQRHSFIRSLLKNRDMSWNMLETKSRPVVEAGRTEIDEIVREIVHPKEIVKEKPVYSENTVEYDDKEIIRIHYVDNAEKIQELNGVDYPLNDYQKIVQNDSYLIHMIRSKLAALRQKSGLERGFTKGIISSRDLSHVVASKGKFTRPFKSLNPTFGASLLILVDESGSMQENNIGEARRAAIILAEALEKTSINFGIIGFSAKANDMVVCEKVYKRMEEKLDKRKLGSINCSGMYSENRDGSSFLTIAKHHFTQGDRKTPIIIVISDGIPCHSGTSYCNKEGLQATMGAVKQLQSAGIKMFALSLDDKNTRYLQDIYGSKRYHVVEHPRELAEKLLYLVTSIAESLK